MSAEHLQRREILTLRHMLGLYANKMAYEVPLSLIYMLSVGSTAHRTI